MLVNDELHSSQDESRILHPSSRTLFRFWETMRGDRSAPDRSDLDLKQLRDLVPWLFIAEYAAKTRMFRWRLAGTGICELHRRELTGANMLAGWDSFEADVISRFLSSTLHTFQPSVLRMRFRTDHAATIGVEMPAFPIIAADGATTHLFGGVFPFSDSYASHYNHIESREITAAHSVWTEYLPSSINQQDQGLRGAHRRPFRLIKGGVA
jgi:hypothetical protein